MLDPGGNGSQAHVAPSQWYQQNVSMARLVWIFDIRCHLQAGLPVDPLVGRSIT